jgi:PBS lyase HEAT-like repeat-containing protein
MFKRHSFSFLPILLLSVSQLASAQELQEARSREVLVKESIAKLDSEDIKVAAEAARLLGMYRATEAVPKMLQVLQSSRLLRKTEAVVAKDKPSLTSWVSIDVRAELINSLGLIGDKRAVRVLEKYLKMPLSNDEVFTGNVAQALYLITGKSYEYKDYDREHKLYEPSPRTEEEFRKRARLDLKPTAGLIAALEIEGHDSGGVAWMGNRPVNINLVITNLSTRPIEIDAAKNNFVFSSVAGDGERRVTPAGLLPSPESSRADQVVISPGEKLELRWVVKLKDSPLSRGWIGYVNVKCVYINPQKHKQGVMWRGEQLISNSVERYYFSEPD